MHIKHDSSRTHLRMQIVVQLKMQYQLMVTFFHWLLLSTCLKYLPYPSYKIKLGMKIINMSVAYTQLSKLKKIAQFTTLSFLFSSHKHFTQESIVFYMPFLFELKVKIFY